MPVDNEVHKVVISRPAIVADTNVLVSAFIQITQGHTDSPSVVLVRAIVDGRLELCTSAPLLFELVSTLQKSRLKNKYGYDDRDAVEWMQIIGESARDIVDIRGLDFGCRDPRDSMVIETAYNARVQFVVARDLDLKEPVVVETLRKRVIEVVNVGEILGKTLAAE